MTDPRLTLVLSLLLLAPATAAQEQPPRSPPEAEKGPDEKDLVHDYDKSMKSKDPAARAAAVMALGDLSRELADKGTSRYLAKALAKALEDEDLEVQSAVVAQMSWGRDVDTTLDALGGHVEAVREAVEKRITRPDEESKTYVNRATRLFGDTAQSLANYRDDRSVDLLASCMGKLHANTESNDTSTRLVGRLAEALLSLGTEEAVRTCVRQTQQYSESDGFQEPAAKELHRVLAIFATRVGKAPPDFTQNYYVDWDNWFEKHKDGFPKKLGKIKEPPMTIPSGTDPMAPQDDGGAAPR